MVDLIKIIDEPIELLVYQGGDYTVVTYGDDENDYEKGGNRFISLIDTPESYVGQAGKTPVVKVDETGLEFESIVASKFTNLSDCPASYKGQKKKLVQVKDDEVGLQFVNINTDINVFPFKDLSDVQGDYTGYANYVLTIAPGENGVSYTDPALILPDIITAQTISNPIISVNSKGLVTGLTQGQSTSLPEYPNLTMLYGNDTRVPTHTNAGVAYQVPVVTSDSSAITMQYLSSLYSSIGNPTLHTSASTANINYLQVVTSGTGVTLLSQNDSNIASDLTLAVNSGSVNLGSSSTTAVKVKSKLDMTQSYLTSDNYLWFKPSQTSTLRIDTSALVNPNYYQLVNNVNDIPNKEYVDKAIDSAISGLGGTSIYTTTPVELTALQPITSLGTVKAGSVIDEIRIATTMAFNSEDQLTIGTDISNALLCDVRVNSVGLISIPTYYKITAATEFKVYINGTATQGRATVYLKYL